jgi:PAS domain S-box-containing protein
MTGSKPVRPPDLAELKTLVACAAEGSMVDAAASLGISRPAVAKRIRNLEALAGQPLLHRGGRGVRLTDAGATLQASARRMLAESDALTSVLIEIRGEGPSPIAGLRDLLGHSSAVSRASQTAEARLAETERVLEVVLRASATGVVISNPDTAVIHEVNDAFCRFTGRTRSELLSQSGTGIGAEHQSGDRDEVIDTIRRAGVAERVVFQIRRPDGTERVGATTARFIALAGTQQLLSTVDDITEQHRLDAELTSTLAAYRALNQLATLLLSGQPVIESLQTILPDLRRSGPFTTALLWHNNDARPVFVDGDQPPPQLHHELQQDQNLPTNGVIHLGDGRHPGALTGWAIPLAITEHTIILLSHDIAPPTGHTPLADVLADLATLASNHA